MLSIRTIVRAVVYTDQLTALFGYYAAQPRRDRPVNAVFKNDSIRILTPFTEMDME